VNDFSSSFYKQLLRQYYFAKKLQSQNVIRENLCKTLLSEKGTTKMLINFKLCCKWAEKGCYNCFRVKNNKIQRTRKKWKLSWNFLPKWKIKIFTFICKCCFSTICSQNTRKGCVEVCTVIFMTKTFNWILHSEAGIIGTQPYLEMAQ